MPLAVELSTLVLFWRNSSNCLIIEVILCCFSSASPQTFSACKVSSTSGCSDFARDSRRFSAVSFLSLLNSVLRSMMPQHLKESTFSESVCACLQIEFHESPRSINFTAGRRFRLNTLVLLVRRGWESDRTASASSVCYQRNCSFGGY